MLSTLYLIKLLSLDSSYFVPAEERDPTIGSLVRRIQARVILVGQLIDMTAIIVECLSGDYTPDMVEIFRYEYL